MSNKPTGKEADMQKRIVFFLRLQFPKLVFFANPFSELKLKGSPQYVKRVIAGMKEQGWEKDIPDLHIAHSSHGYSGLSLELKRSEKEMPTHFMPRKKCYQIINKKDDGFFSDTVEHLRGQAMKLHRLNESGNLALFACDEKEILEIIKWYMSPTDGDKMSFHTALEFKMRNERGRIENIKILARE